MFNRGSGTSVGYDPMDRATQRNPYAVYAELRERDPVHHVEDRDFWVLSRFGDVFAAARDTETFSSAQGLSFEGDEIARLGLKPTIVMMDPPDHTTYRRLVSRGFTPRQVAELEPALRAYVAARVDELVDAAHGGAGDAVELLARPVPAFVVAHYLGVPDADRSQFDGWANAIVQANAEGGVVERAATAVADLYGYFTELIERRRRDPGDDMISTLVQVDIDGLDLDLERILGYAFVMIAGGNDTATGLLAGSMASLTEHPDQRRLLIDDPSLIPGAVDELLRYLSPVQGLSRTTTRSVTVGEHTIAADSKVHLLYGSANRDPREFGPTADVLEVTRTIPRLMTFTSGPHYCLGAAAARLQGRVVLEELLARAPEFTVDVEAGRYAPGPFVRRHEYLPFSTN